MKINTFIHCKNFFEVAMKTARKGRDIDVLYCLIETDIYVMQSMKLLPITLEQFAQGLDIDLAIAQVILHQKPESVAKAKEIMQKSITDFESTVDNCQRIIAIKETNEQIEQVKKEVTALVKDVVSDGIDYAAKFSEATKELQKLKVELEKLKSVKTELELLKIDLSGAKLEIEKYKQTYGELETVKEETEEEKVEEHESENSEG